MSRGLWEAFEKAKESRARAIEAGKISAADGLSAAQRADEERRRCEAAAEKRKRDEAAKAAAMTKAQKAAQLSLLKRTERQEKRLANKAAHAAARPAELARLKAEKDEARALAEIEAGAVPWGYLERRNHERRRS